MRYRLAHLFTKWGIDWSSYLQSARCISNTCGVLFWPQAAKWQRLITVSLPSPFWITLRACSQELTSCSSKPTTWIWWSWAQKEQSKCQTNTFQSVICTSAYSFQADNMDQMILSMNRTSRVSDKHISVSDMRNCLFISGQPQMHLSHNIIRNYMLLYPKKTSNLMDLMIPSINKTSNCQLIC